MMCFSSSAQSRFHYGARAGNNIINGIWTKSFNIGGIVEYDISSQSDIFCLESGLVLNWKETEIMYQNAAGIKKVATTPIYLEVPVNALYNVNFGASELQFFGGPYLGYGIVRKTETKFNDKSTKIKYRINGDLKAFDFGLNIGTGIKMDNILVRLQYGYGLRNLDPEGSRSRVISISLGCMFGRESL
jgi:hypothetical protein